MPSPLLTLPVHQALCAARDAGETQLTCSLDLQRTQTQLQLAREHWQWQEQRYPYPERCKDRTIYYWDGQAFAPLSRYGTALIKLVPTEWGAPTFEIDGIKMLPSAQLSPYEDARNKVALIAPRGKRILDTCGGLGYFAAWCLQEQAASILSFEKNPDVIWLRTHNPWSPDHEAVSPLQLRHADVSQEISALPDASFDAILHDPPRFGIAGELYSQRFYGELARVLVAGGLLFHYTGTPNKLTSGRDVPREVSQRLTLAGFACEVVGDGVLARKAARAASRRAGR
ncbi:hypothetical protein SAMN04488038_11841 [Solimonas aquatica]|uniref:SAM-dependent methyltransferase n=1 Tax=Solimonas aquatica TaxID=489703 RepID=A0A1H9M1N8_9GAMM|nr:SAM-dependent methyltransferase [Solimonas aquatica]SER17606.1 hypothetical protein SAMN04488038_11841 [Solimonas aquatica]